MVIEESIIINAPIEKVWGAFIDVTCWNKWNSVIENMSQMNTEHIKEGKKLNWCIRPFSFPIHFEPTIERIVANRIVVWSGSKFGIKAVHEFHFQQKANAVLVISRESFSFSRFSKPFIKYSKAEIRTLTKRMLSDLKKGTESL